MVSVSSAAITHFGAFLKITEPGKSMNLISRAPFFEHNRKLVAEVEELEHKSRRQDVLVDEERIYAFYDARIPQGIHNGADFDKWRREAEAKDKRLLFMSRDDLMRHGADAVTVELFPEALSVGETACRLSYRFEQATRSTASPSPCRCTS